MPVYRFMDFGKAKPSVKTRLIRFCYEVLSIFVVALLLAGSVIVFGSVKLITVSGSSMTPTLQDGDRLIISGLSNSYERGDIVVIGRSGEDTLIKRVIAVEGDVLNMDFYSGDIMLNGELLEEDYIAEKTHLYYDNGPVFPLQVPKGYVFVMGDNRNDSLDSRSAEVGFVSTQSILGKMVDTLD